MQTIEIIRQSITDLDTEIIVNAANKRLQAGGGVCGYIFDVAGRSELKKACDAIGGCPTGSAVITDGFKLCRYIVHAVGPEWRGGNDNEPEQLYNCYQAALDLAKQKDCHSIGFPLISAGIYGYPLYGAWTQALTSIRDWAKKNKDYDIRIVFAVLDASILEKGKSSLVDIAPELMLVRKKDWKTLEMPEQNEYFELSININREQLSILRHGHYPREMEDKWFWYMEDNVLYAHRSWTGFCIYIADFSEIGKVRVTVNRDPEQYTCTSIDEDIKKFTNLLSWWISTPYDHQSEWLQETAQALKKAAANKDKLLINGVSYDAIFFHKPDEPYGFLSNWYLSDFTIDGMKFTSNEQYIMYRKCLLFNDTDSAKKVLETDDPQKLQDIGRTAKGYDQKLWNGSRQAIAMRGMLAKFEQDEDLKQKLLETSDAYLVECAVSDSIWACGIGLYDEARFDQSRWTGTNILGFALMEVREILKNR